MMSFDLGMMFTGINASYFDVKMDVWKTDSLEAGGAKEGSVADSLEY